jgi:hypothetical protein
LTVIILQQEKKVKRQKEQQMRKRILWTAVLIAVMYAPLVWTAKAAERLTEKQLSLTDIKELSIVVQGMTEETKKIGLSAEQIQAAVEEKLKETGIKVVSAEEAERILGSPSLYVNISARKRERVAAFMFHVDVGVLQEVELVRDPMIQIMSITWIKGQTGDCPSRGFVKAMRETVGYLMDQFCEDYRKANPPIKVEG